MSARPRPTEDRDGYGDPLHATVTAKHEHRPATEGRLETALLGALGLLVATMSWALPGPDGVLDLHAGPAHGRTWVVVAGLVIALAGLPALRRRPHRPWAAALRAGAVLAVATVAATTDPTLAAVALTCSLTVAAAYPLSLPATPGAMVSVAAAGGCWIPAAAALLTGDGLDAAVDPTRTAWALALAAAGAVCLALAAVATSAGRALDASNGLAGARARLIRRTDRELARATTTDPRTDLPNRAEFLRLTAKALSRGHAVGGNVAVLVVTLDRLDRVSDGLGTQAAHDALVHAARRLRAARPAEDVVAHIGHTDLAVMIEGVGPEGCDGIARRTVALLEEPLDAGARRVHLPATLGVAIAADGLDTADELLRSAEEARDAARRRPYSRWATFDAALRAHSVSQAGIELDLRDALRRGDLTLAFQPVWPMDGVLQQMLGPVTDGTGDASGSPAHVSLDGITVEALARWIRPDGSAVPPSRFVALAEEIGLGPTLGFQILDRALDAVASWRADGLPVDRVCVNLSRSQLEDPDFASVVAARLRAHRRPAAVLAVDVRVADLTDPESVAGTIAQLTSLGVDVTIDDLGLAGAGLGVLRHLAVTGVKLDRVLTCDLGADDRVVRGVVDLCHDLGLRVVAEGVETIGQLRGAHRLGLHGAQGYLLARPVQAADLPVVLSLPPTATGELPERAPVTADAVITPGERRAPDHPRTALTPPSPAPLAPATPGK